MVVEKEILLGLNKETITYNIETYTTVTSLEEVKDNIMTAKVTKRFIDKDEVGYLYEVNLIERNQPDNGGFNNMENYLSKLQKKLLIYTNDIGSIISISNMESIKGFWYNRRQEFVKLFNHIHEIEDITKRVDELVESEESFMNVFAQSEIGTLLFPAVFTEMLQKDQAIIQRKFFQNFFGAYSLPLLLETQLVYPDNPEITATKIARTGSIEWQFFEEDGIKSFFRETFKDYPYINNFDAFYSELYDLDIKCDISNALQLLYVKVGDIYSFDQKTTLSIQKK